VIHTREAAADTLRLMQEEGAAAAGGVMHCFTESWPVAEASAGQGFYISMSGIVTFKKAAIVRDVAQRVPLDRLLVETDSPYLRPGSLSRQNQSAWLRKARRRRGRAPAWPDLPGSCRGHDGELFRLFPEARSKVAQ
jgi:TatD DNase family protein